MIPFPTEVNPQTNVEVKDSCNCWSSCCFPKRNRHKKTCEVAKAEFDKIKHQNEHHHSHHYHKK